MFPMQGVPPLLRKRKHEDLPRTVPSTSLNAYLMCCKHTPFSRQIKTWEYLLIKRCFLNHYPSQGALCSQWNCRPETSIFTLEAWGKWPSHTLLIGTKLQPLEDHSHRSGMAGGVVAYPEQIPPHISAYISPLPSSYHIASHTMHKHMHTHRSELYGSRVFVGLGQHHP